MSVANVKTRPEAYDLGDPREVLRLYRECAGYLRTCGHHHHGTDFDGRRFAIEALDEMLKRGEQP